MVYFHEFLFGLEIKLVDWKGYQKTPFYQNLPSNCKKLWKIVIAISKHGHLLILFPIMFCLFGAKMKIAEPDLEFRNQIGRLKVRPSKILIGQWINWWIDPLTKWPFEITFLLKASIHHYINASIKEAN